MNRVSTLFLRLVILLIAIVVLAACILPLPRMISREAAKTPETAWIIYLFLVGAYVQAALFLFALYQAFRLLGYVDGDQTFSDPSVSALRRIKLCALISGALMVAGIVWVVILSAGSGDDSAGPVVLGLIGTFVSAVVAAAVGVMQTQVQQAIDKTRNEISAD